MIKCSIQQEDTIFVYIYAPNIEPKYVSYIKYTKHQFCYYAFTFTSEFLKLSYFLLLVSALSS